MEEGLESREIYIDLTQSIRDLSDLENAIKISPNDSAEQLSASQSESMERHEVFRIGKIMAFCREDTFLSICGMLATFRDFREQGLLVNAQGEPVDEQGRSYADPGCKKEPLLRRMHKNSQQWFHEVIARLLRP